MQYSQFYLKTTNDSLLTYRFKQEKGHTPKSASPFFHLHAHTGSHPEGGGDSGKYGDQNVQDFSPDVLVFHFMIFDL